MKTIKKDIAAKDDKKYASTFSGNWKPDGIIYQRIYELDISQYSDDLTKEDALILKTINNNIIKIKSGKKISKNDFLPVGYEDNEAKNLNTSDFIRYVIYRYKYNIYPLSRKVGDYPPCVQIEPTSYCNFRCIMCYQIDKSFSSKSQGHLGMMNLNRYKKIIDELQNKVEAVTLASRGEPLLNPDIKEMIKYTGNKFLGFKINTNASMLTEEMSHVLLQSGLNTLVFSVDAADKETYEKIRINGDFDKVTNNIKMFHKIKKQHYKNSKIITKVSGVLVSKENQSMESLIGYWKDYCDDVAFVNYTPWESAYENKINDISSPCSDLWRRMFIWHDGRVNPCDFDYKTTLFSEDQPVFPLYSIKEIWNSKLYSNLRQKHLNNERNQVEPCKRCYSG